MRIPHTIFLSKWCIGFGYNLSKLEDVLIFAHEVGDRRKDFIHEEISIADLHVRLSNLLPIAINLNIHKQASSTILEGSQILIYNDLVNLMGFQSRHRLTDSTKEECWFHDEAPSTIAKVSSIIIGTNNEENRCRRGQWTKEQDKSLYELV